VSAETCKEYTEKSGKGWKYSHTLSLEYGNTVDELISLNFHKPTKSENNDSTFLYLINFNDNVSLKDSKLFFVSKEGVKIELEAIITDNIDAEFSIKNEHYDFITKNKIRRLDLMLKNKVLRLDMDNSEKLKFTETLKCYSKYASDQNESTNSYECDLVKEDKDGSLKISTENFFMFDEEKKVSLKISKHNSKFSLISYAPNTTIKRCHLFIKLDNNEDFIIRQLSDPHSKNIFMTELNQNSIKKEDFLESFANQNIREIVYFDSLLKERVLVINKENNDMNYITSFFHCMFNLNK
jgi:hypothetical protein